MLVLNPQNILYIYMSFHKKLTIHQSKLIISSYSSKDITHNLFYNMQTYYKHHYMPYCTLYIPSNHLLS